MEDIPKRFVPIKKGDVPGRIRRRIVEGLSKGAVLAWQSKPKARGPGGGPAVVEDGATQVREGTQRGQQLPPPPPQQLEPLKPHPIWGEINHPGWSPPDSHDLPNVEYAAIMAELPYIIEEKAIHIASRQATPSPELASRKPCMSLARYISYLTALGYVDPRVGEVFVKEYEKCRFWLAEVEGVGEAQFRQLMKVFAGLLRVMDGAAVEPEELRDDRERYGPGGSGGVYMREGLDGDAYPLRESSHTGQSGSVGTSVDTFGSVIARPPFPDQPPQPRQHGGFMYHPARDTDYETEYEYSNGEEGLSRRRTASSSEENTRRSGYRVDGWSIQNGLRRVFTQSTTKSGSSFDGGGSVRRTMWSGAGGGGNSEGVDMGGEDEAVEMRYMSSGPRARVGGGVRQRTSQGTFG